MSGWQIALLAVAGVVFLLLLLLIFGRAKLRVTCRDEVSVSLRILLLRLRLYPQKNAESGPSRFCRHPRRALARELRRQRREAKRAEKKRLKKKKKAAQTANLPKPNLRENLSMITALVKDAYRATKGKIRLRSLRMHIVVGTGDAAETALLWGGVSACSSVLLTWLDRHFMPIEDNTGNIDIRPDFAGGETCADIDLEFSVRLFSALRIVLALRNSYNEEKTKAQIKAIRRVRKKALKKQDREKTSQM